MTVGYSQEEIDGIQDRWNLRFPPDLIDILREYRPLIGGQGSFDWILSDSSDIQSRLDWPFDGLWADVKRGHVWWPEWGEKPASLGEQQSRFKEIFSMAPKLIPLFGLRYLPQEPFERGNPVFSLYQSDVIYYGANLEDWMERERHGHDYKPWPPVKEIPFWSEAERWDG